jgi:hypothetical protein
MALADLMPDDREHDSANVLPGPVAPPPAKGLSDAILDTLINGAPPLSLVQ